MDEHIQQIGRDSALPVGAERELAEEGFTVLAGAFGCDEMAEITTSYDAAMRHVESRDFRAGSTTDRMSDLLSCGTGLDRVYTCRPMLHLVSLALRRPFKLSSFLGRTLRAGAAAQELHTDLDGKPMGDAGDAELLGFVLMIDAFREENGATRFIPGSLRWAKRPRDRLADCRARCEGEVLACGERGSILLFHGAVWHGHTANVTAAGRRSIQGYFVPREVPQDFDFRGRLSAECLARLGPVERYLLDVAGPPHGYGLGEGLE